MRRVLRVDVGAFLGFILAGMLSLFCLALGGIFAYLTMGRWANGERLAAVFSLLAFFFSIVAAVVWGLGAFSAISHSIVFADPARWDDGPDEPPHFKRDPVPIGPKKPGPLAAHAVSVTDN